VALDLLARKAWTRHQLRGRLLRRGAPLDVAESIAADFEARGYLDDRAFAIAWVETRGSGRGLGARRLREELLARGVDREVVEVALAGVGGEGVEEARARALAARRLPSIARATPDRVARRLYEYLLRRGFSGRVARRVVVSACGEALPRVDPDP
jgi:regulatory protein